MRIAIHKIRPNPFRNFDKYPIDQEHVDVLKGAISKSGMWQNLEGRKDPDNPNYVQIAYGHHRIKAAKQLKIKFIDISIVELDEDQMIDRMVTENVTQRGYSTIAIYDSVRAVTKRLAYILLTSEWEMVGTNVPTIFKNKRAFDSAKSLLLSDKNGQTQGIGCSLIMRYNKSLSEKETKQAISALKSTGELKNVLDEVSKRIEAEAKIEKIAAEKLTKEIETKEKKEKAEKKKRQIEEKAKKDKIAKETIDRQLRKNRLIAEQKKIDAQELKDQAKEKANKKAITKAKTKAVEIADQAKIATKVATKQAKAKVDSKALLIFPTPHKADAFRKMVLAKYHDGSQIIPIEKHVELAKLLISTWNKFNPTKKGVKYVSASFIDTFIRPIHNSGKLNQYTIDKEEQTKALQDNLYVKIDRHIKQIISHTKDVQWHVQEFGKILKSNNEIIYQLESTKISNLPFELEQTIEGLKKLKLQFEKLA